MKMVGYRNTESLILKSNQDVICSSMQSLVNVTGDRQQRGNNDQTRREISGRSHSRTQIAVSTMAFRAASLAKHARTLSTRLSRQTQIPLRAFSCSSIQSSSSFIPAAKPPPYPIDTLVADVLSTNDKLADNPPKARSTGQEPPKEGSFGVDLPPLEEWYKHFPWSTEAKSRSTLANPEICKRLAEAIIPEGSKDKIVLEAFPGALVLFS